MGAIELLLLHACNRRGDEALWLYLGVVMMMMILPFVELADRLLVHVSGLQLDAQSTID